MHSALLHLDFVPVLSGNYGNSSLPNAIMSLTSTPSTYEHIQVFGMNTALFIAAVVQLRSCVRCFLTVLCRNFQSRTFYLVDSAVSIKLLRGDLEPLTALNRLIAAVTCHFENKPGWSLWVGGRLWIHLHNLKWVLARSIWGCCCHAQSTAFLSRCGPVLHVWLFVGKTKSRTWYPLI